MISRLAELRDAAGASDVATTDPALEKPSDEPAELPKEEIDIEWQEFTEEVKEIFKEILEDEGATKQACIEVRQRVSNLDEIVKLEKEALLPSKLAQLASRFESQELVCQRMIRRAKEMLTTLRAEEQNADLDEDDVARVALLPVRNSIAKARSIEFKGLVQGFFAARSTNREEMIQRANRQLRFAYPDALEEEITDIMEFPELAFVAISRRLEKGSEVSLDGILGEMEGKKADTKKLEQGAKELKLMFLQFAELIDTQGESLTAIEANIKTVIEETTEALGVLLDAEEEKRAYQRKMLKWYLLCPLILLCFLNWCGLQPQFWLSWMYHGAVSLGSSAYEGAKSGATQLRGEAKKASLLQSARMAPRHWNRKQLEGREMNRLAPDSSQVLEGRIPSQGFIAPRRNLLQDPILRSVALTARGGAARHRGLRKPRAEAEKDNSTAP